jgi:hypothetical protein
MRLLHDLHVMNIRFELLRPGLRLCKPLVKISQLLAKLLDLMIAAAELLLVEAIGVIPLKKLLVGLVEMAAEFLFAHGVRTHCSRPERRARRDPVAHRSQVRWSLQPHIRRA